MWSRGADRDLGLGEFVKRSIKSLGVASLLVGTLTIGAGLGVPTIAAEAAASTTDISVVYSTQNDSDAPQDGSYTVEGRVGQTRNDMKLVYTIQSTTVAYPVPVLEYTGDLWDEADATYTFRFGCDPTVTTFCANYASLISTMNSATSLYDNHSIAKFSAEITPIIMHYGGSVPKGITGTITTSVTSAWPGSGSLAFYLQEGETSNEVPEPAHLSPTVTAPITITEPVFSVTADTWCAADLESYTSDGVTYTPNDEGRDGSYLSASVSDTGIKPDDATPVGVDQNGLTFTLNGQTYVGVAAINTALGTLPAGTYTVTTTYVSPDKVTGYDRDRTGEVVGNSSVTTTITVLGSEDSACYTASAASSSSAAAASSSVAVVASDSAQSSSSSAVESSASSSSASSGVLADTTAASNSAALLGAGLMVIVAGIVIAFASLTRQTIRRSANKG